MPVKLQLSVSPLGSLAVQEPADGVLFSATEFAVHDTSGPRLLNCGVAVSVATRPSP